MGTWRRVIAGLQIVGGIFGIGFIALELSYIRVNAATLLIAIIVLLIYVFSLVAGVLLWRDHRWGRPASIIVQAIQLPKLLSPILIFNICLGLDIYPYLMLGNHGLFRIGFELKALAFYQLHLGVPIPGVGLGVSIPACIFLTMLIKNRKESPSQHHFYVPPPTDPAYWNPPPDPSLWQQPQPPGPQAVSDQDDSGKDRQP